MFEMQFQGCSDSIDQVINSLCPKYPIMTQNQSIFYMCKASIMVDHCIQHEQNPDSSQDISLQTYIYEIVDINATFWPGILAQSQGIFYMHEVPIVADYCNEYEQNQLFLSEVLHQI